MAHYDVETTGGRVDSTLWMAHGIIAKEKAMQDLYNAWGK